MSISEHTFASEEKFKDQIFTVICDSLILEMMKLYVPCECVQGEFSFLIDYRNEDPEGKRKTSRKIIEKYKRDLGEDFDNGLIHFHKYVMREVWKLEEKFRMSSSKFIITRKRILSGKYFLNVANVWSDVQSHFCETMTVPQAIVGVTPTLQPESNS
jgi:hypothetical protein